MMQPAHARSQLRRIGLSPLTLSVVDDVLMYAALCCLEGEEEHLWEIGYNAPRGIQKAGRERGEPMTIPTHTRVQYR